MTKRKIEVALKRKGIEARSIEYVRGEPTPSGYAEGWNIEIEEETEDEIYKLDNKLYVSEFMQFDNTSQVISWVKKLPNLKKEQNQ